LEKLRTLFAWLIAGMWVVNLALDALLRDEWEVAPAYHAAFLLVAGWLFAPAVINRRDRGA
jgi:hypothetical protein